MITLREIIEGKAELKVGHYGVPKPVYAFGTAPGVRKAWETRHGGGNSYQFQKNKGWENRVRAHLKGLDNPTKAEHNIGKHLDNTSLSSKEKMERVKAELHGIDDSELTTAESNIKQLSAYGTSDGANKGWGSRGRGRAKKNFEPPSSVVKKDDGNWTDPDSVGTSYIKGAQKVWDGKDKAAREHWLKSVGQPTSWASSFDIHGDMPKSVSDALVRDYASGRQ